MPQYTPSAIVAEHKSTFKDLAESVYCGTCEDCRGLQLPQLCHSQSVQTNLWLPERNYNLTQRKQILTLHTTEILST